MKSGYLRGKYASDYITVLNVPFCNSRYKLKEKKNRVPEIFLGHHRVGILLALRRYVVSVLVCSDAFPGSCFCKRKIHYACGGT